MPAMFSYPHRQKSGQITCYLNRTYHVLTTFHNLETCHRERWHARHICDAAIELDRPGPAPNFFTPDDVSPRRVTTPFPSSTTSSWSASWLPIVSTFPEGHLITRLSTRAAEPSPKWSRGSLADSKLLLARTSSV